MKNALLVLGILVGYAVAITIALVLYAGGAYIALHFIKKFW